MPKQRWAAVGSGGQRWAAVGSGAQRWAVVGSVRSARRGWSAPQHAKSGTAPQRVCQGCGASGAAYGRRIRPAWRRPPSQRCGPCASPARRTRSQSE
eukprot:1982871-Prymnesium_polylepis.1